MKFRSGAAAAAAAAPQSVGKNPFESLTLMERHDLVMATLNEMGAQNIQVQGSEIIHSCLLPMGNHPNGDRNPSASINFDTMVSGCWVCGGGTFLWWVAAVGQLEGASQALNFVTEKSGISVNRPNTLQEVLDFIERTQNPESPMYVEPPTYDPGIIEPWKVVHPYLTEWRKIPAQNVMDLNVGYAVLRTRRTDGVFIDSHRIIIPHFFKGKLYGWQSRRLGDDGTPKYVNTPDMPKDTTLYNYSVGERPMVVVVESPMSVITHKHVADMIATFGSMVTDRQLDLVSRSRAKKIVLWFDNDEAGWNATARVGDYLMNHGMVYVVDSPYVGDPGDLPSHLVEELLAEKIIPYALWHRPEPSGLVPWESPVNSN